MAAEVSSLVGVRGGYKEEQRRAMGSDVGVEKSTALITRDLLGGSTKLSESQDLDLELQVPTGWEKRLDLKSGKIYIQRPNSTPIYNLKHHANPPLPELQDLNSSPSRMTLNLFEETSLELTTDSSQPSSINHQSACTLDKVKSALERVDKDPTKRPSSSNYQSVCTLDKVKSALERVEKDPTNKRSSISSEENDEKLIFLPMAAGCPGCLSYVLITENNPRCPRCTTVVPFPDKKKKKPRIDLNISI